MLIKLSKAKSLELTTDKAKTKNYPASWGRFSEKEERQ